MIATILIAVLIIAFTCWVKRREWFHRSPPRVVVGKTPTPAKPTTTPPTVGKRAYEAVPKKERFVGALLWALGVLAAIAVAAIVWVFVVPTLRFAYKGLQAATTPTSITRQQPVVAFPTSGSGEATKDRPIKAYLDPKRSHTRPFPLGKAKYVFASNPKLVFNDSGPNPQVWDKMPAGNYLIYPRNAEKVEFSWWID